MKSSVDKEQIKKIADNCEEIGDECFKQYRQSKKMEAAKVGISAYRNTLYANSLLLKSEKL